MAAHSYAQLFFKEFLSPTSIVWKGSDVCLLVFLNGTKESILQQAAEEYPNECCGVLLGSRIHGIRNASRVIPVSNEDKVNKRNSFLIDPMAFVRIEEMAEREGLEIVGFYHSHPDCKAELSMEDQNHMIPDFSYPIVSVSKGICQELVSFVKKNLPEEIICRERIRVIRRNTNECYGICVCHTTRFC